MRLNIPILYAGIMSLPLAMYGEGRGVAYNELEHQRNVSAIGETSWDNPALMPWKFAGSLSKVSGGYDRSHESAPVVTGAGDGSYDWRFDARTYIHAGSSTVWGDAGYANGKLSNPLWNESGEYDRVAPYIIADSIGGDMKRERYYFGGGYARQGERISWGVEGSYEAVQSYRQADPRPKNISGCLNLKAGIAVRTFRDYMVAVASRFERYRMSTDISFVSEMGDSKLYHLTGLGTRFTRFDGAGSNVFSDTYSYGGSLNLLPASGRGFFLNTSLGGSTMRHVIADLNRLPLAKLTGLDGDLEVGYKDIAMAAGGNPGWSWGIWGDWRASRNHGKENIFGDAATGSYPVIGTLELYADNSYGGSIKGYAGMSASKWEWHLLPTVGWNHHRIVYLSPRREWLDEHLYSAIELGGSTFIGSRSMLSLDLRWREQTPTRNSLSREAVYADKEDIQLWRVVTSDFDAAVSRADHYSAKVEYQYILSQKYLLGAEVEGSYSNYRNGIKGYGLNASVFLKF